MRREQKPYMLIGSPDCKAFSSLQAMNEARSRDASAYRIAKEKSIRHINFMVSLYREQIEDGHYFLHEHPRWATSWKLPEVEKLMAMPGLGLSHADQCQYGSEAQSGEEKGQAYPEANRLSQQLVQGPRGVIPQMRRPERTVLEIHPHGCCNL